MMLMVSKADAQTLLVTLSS